MTTEAGTAGKVPLRRIRPIGLARADLLKLRKRRGMLVMIAVLTIVPEVIAYGILAILHSANPDHHGPAGGIDNLGNGMSVLVLLGSVAAIIVGASAGADDVNSGVFRELVVTGRSRVALFASRIPGGVAYLFPFVALAYAISAVVSGLAHGDLPAPSVTLLVESGLWVLLELSFYVVIGVGLASLTGSRAYTIGILLAWRAVVGHILTAITALGVYREAVPDVAFGRLAPAAIEDHVNEGPNVGASLGAAVLVLVLWVGIAFALGAWRTATRDA
jgi:hypothetical protein